MGLLERVERYRAQASSPVGAGLVDRWDAGRGHDDSMFSPDSYGDYLVTSNEVYSAVDLRARLLAGRRLQLFKGQKPNLVEQTSGPLSDLLRHVNPFWTYNRLIRATEQCMCLWGEAYWVVEKSGPRNAPSEIWWVKPSRMTPVPSAAGYLAGFLYEPAGGGKPIPFAADEVVWFRYPNPLDEFSALSPIAAARLAADVAAAGMKSNRDLFSRGLHLGGIVVPATGKATFGEDQARDLEKALERRWTGSDKAHRWAVLRYEAEFKGMDVTPKDAEFIQAMNLSARHVWRALGIPSPLLNDGEFATLANVLVYQTILWEHTLVPEGNFLAAEIEEQLLRLPAFRGQADSIGFDYSDVPALQEAHTATWGRERGQLEIGAITINEWRKGYGMPDVEWGDQPWMPVNKAKINQDGSIEISGTASDTAGDTAGGGGQAGGEMSVAELVLALQKVYLAVGVVVTVDEARAILNRGGAGLGPAPDGLGKKAPGGAVSNGAKPVVFSP